MCLSRGGEIEYELWKKTFRIAIEEFPDAFQNMEVFMF